MEVLKPQHLLKRSGAVASLFLLGSGMVHADRRPDVPLTYAVCVTLEHRRPKLDGFYAEREDALARAKTIVREGWDTLGENDTEDDVWPPSRIFKVTVENTTDGEPVCRVDPRP